MSRNRLLGIGIWWHQWAESGLAEFQSRSRQLHATANPRSSGTRINYTVHSDWTDKGNFTLVIWLEYSCFNVLYSGSIRKSFLSTSVICYPYNLVDSCINGFWWFSLSLMLWHFQPQWLGRDCLSQDKPILRDSKHDKWLVPECAFHMQTNQSRIHTLNHLLYLVHMLQEVTLLYLITQGQVPDHEREPHTSESAEIIQTSQF